MLLLRRVLSWVVGVLRLLIFFFFACLSFLLLAPITHSLPHSLAPLSFIHQHHTHPHTHTHVCWCPRTLLIETSPLLLSPPSFLPYPIHVHTSFPPSLPPSLVLVLRGLKRRVNIVHLGKEGGREGGREGRKKEGRESRCIFFF